jgi:GT2 family glycosyltransferase
MNVGLEQARNEVILFLDDDIIPGPHLVTSHVRAHADGAGIVAGQVLQPGEEASQQAEGSETFYFSSSRKQYVKEFMGGNFSLRRSLALALGGFDENFVRVAYRYEAEFAKRALAAGERILFEPAASIRHLKEARGGTRAFGHHLTTVKPGHAVGAYYFLLRTENFPGLLISIMSRPFQAIRTRHHLKKPWWIPGTLIAELLGLAWASLLYLGGPRLIDYSQQVKTNNE